MENITIELNLATDYLRAMKRTRPDSKEDCDNVILHLANIESLVIELYSQKESENTLNIDTNYGDINL